LLVLLAPRRGGSLNFGGLLSGHVVLLGGVSGEVEELLGLVADTE